MNRHERDWLTQAICCSKRIRHLRTTYVCTYLFRFCLSIHTRKEDYGDQTLLWSFHLLRAIRLPQNTSTRGLLGKNVVSNAPSKLNAYFRRRRSYVSLWGSNGCQICSTFEQVAKRNSPFSSSLLSFRWLFCSVRRKTKYCNWMLPNFFIKSHVGATIKL